MSVVWVRHAQKILTGLHSQERSTQGKLGNDEGKFFLTKQNYRRKRTDGHARDYLTNRTVQVQEHSQVIGLAFWLLEYILSHRRELFVRNIRRDGLYVGKDDSVCSNDKIGSVIRVFRLDTLLKLTIKDTRWCYVPPVSRISQRPCVLRWLQGIHGCSRN